MLGEKLRLIDLFSGAGGLSLGFVSSDFCGAYHSLLAVEKDRAAANTYALNFGHHPVDEDIETWLAGSPSIPKADVVIGGPPCQGFSLLNRNRKGDARRALWLPFMEVVAQSEAKAFVMENVPGLLKSPELDEIRASAKNMGFDIQAAVLNCADYGSPQTRRRTIILGTKRDLGVQPDFPPTPTHGRGKDQGRLPWVTVGDVISDLKSPVGTQIRDVAPPYDLHFGRNPTPLSQARYRAVPPGGNRFDLQKIRPDLTPRCWLNKPSGGTDLFGRLWMDRPSVTIRTEFFKPEKGRYLHPSEHRPITHREAARLMGFPDSFRFTGSKAEIARQIGNAVPPHLAAAIARHLQGFLFQVRPDLDVASRA